MSRLDWTNAEAVRRWVIDLRVVLDDLDAVIHDMHSPARSRELGPATHRAKCREARKAIVSALAYALPPAPGDAGPGSGPGPGSGSGPGSDSTGGAAH